MESEDGSRSAIAVESRMSANRRLTSISAPPWCRSMKVKHEVHIFGFFDDGHLPKTLPTDRRPAERDGAQPAARAVRKPAEDRPHAVLHPGPAGEVVAPELVVRPGWRSARRGHADQPSPGARIADRCRGGYHRRMSQQAPIDERDVPGEQEAWHRLHDVIDRITPDIAELPGYFEEGWTAKDAVGHLGAWMARGATMLRQIAAGTYREGEIDIDAENEKFLEALRDVPLDTIHLQVAAAHAELLRAWAQLPEITPEAAYWVRKAGPEHYAEHLPRLEAWVDEVSRRPA